MEAISEFRRCLKTGRVCFGASITFSDPLVTEALADSVDFFWIDLEHSAMSPEVLNGHLLAARARRVPALVRVIGSSTPFIKPVLDAGAEGIIVPQIRSADEVMRVVSDCRYPPLGTRGFGPRVPSNYGRNGGRDYVENANRSLFVSVQIETVEALEAIDDIVAVPGLDSLVIGPYDLSGALGLLGEVEHPKVVAAMETIISKAQAAGLSVGAGLGPDANYACVLAQRGVQWMHVGNDWSYLINYIDHVLSCARSGLQRAADAQTPTDGHL